MSRVLTRREISPRRPDCMAGGHGFEPGLTESESSRRVLVCHASSPAPCSCANTRASGSPSLSFQPDICDTGAGNRFAARRVAWHLDAPARGVHMPLAGGVQIMRGESSKYSECSRAPPGASPPEDLARHRGARCRFSASGTMRGAANVRKKCGRRIARSPKT